jgi:hypothetical protein
MKKSLLPAVILPAVLLLMLSGSGPGFAEELSDLLKKVYWSRAYATPSNYANDPLYDISTAYAPNPSGPSGLAGGDSARLDYFGATADNPSPFALSAAYGTLATPYAVFLAAPRVVVPVVEIQPQGIEIPNPGRPMKFRANVTSGPGSGKFQWGSTSGPNNDVFKFVGHTNRRTVTIVGQHAGSKSLYVRYTAPNGLVADDNVRVVVSPDCTCLALNSSPGGENIAGKTLKWEEDGGKFSLLATDTCGGLPRGGRFIWSSDVQRGKATVNMQDTEGTSVVFTAKANKGTSNYSFVILVSYFEPDSSDPLCSAWVRFSFPQ